MKEKLSVRLEIDTIEALAVFARRKRLTKSVVVEAAVSSFLSPDQGSARSGLFTPNRSFNA
jgi:predicted transcriptional regulator